MKLQKFWALQKRPTSQLFCFFERGLGIVSEIHYLEQSLPKTGVRALLGYRKGQRQNKFVLKNGGIKLGAAYKVVVIKDV